MHRAKKGEASGAWGRHHVEGCTGPSRCFRRAACVPILAATQHTCPAAVREPVPSRASAAGRPTSPRCPAFLTLAMCPGRCLAPCRLLLHQ